jgi:hypothetical protein
MLVGMDSSAATAPLVVLGGAVLGLLLVAVTAVLLLWPGRRGSAGAPPPFEDDLPAFHAHPPGSLGAPARTAAADGHVPLTTARGALAPGQERPDPDGGRGVARFVLALAALALALVGAAAAVALPTARAGSAAEPPSAPNGGGPGSAVIGARLSFGSMVLEQQAVGATMTRPAAGLSTSGRRALLQLRLPTWNCLAPQAPDDPAGAGCVPSVTEFGDLALPALPTSSDGKSLLVRGRVPTYTHPNGSGPVSTGRVYDVTLTVSPGRRLGPSRYVAEGVLTLGSGTARTDGDPALDVLTRGR